MLGAGVAATGTGAACSVIRVKNDYDLLNACAGDGVGPVVVRGTEFVVWDACQTIDGYTYYQIFVDGLYRWIGERHAECA